MSVSVVRSVVASSPTSWDDAISAGLARAVKTVRGITELEVLQETATVDNGQVKEYRVHLKIRFVLDDEG